MIKEKKNYHHGDLKNALIEAGIHIINEEGEQALSMRKVAAACSVSAAAPYAHFSNKEDLISSMQDYVTTRFTAYLEQAAQKATTAEEAMIALGRAYVQFFLDNKQYYAFLFQQPCFSIHLSDFNHPDNFVPFLLFKDAVINYRKEIKSELSQDDLEREVVSLWAYVHGFVAVASMPHVTWDKDWSTELSKLIK